MSTFGVFLPCGAGVGRLEIDDVAQAVFVIVAPDRLERREFATGPRSSPRGPLRCAWRWRFRPSRESSSTAPFHAGTSAPEVVGLRGLRRAFRSQPRWNAAPRRVRPLSLLFLGRFRRVLLGLLGADDGAADADFVEHGIDVLDTVGTSSEGRIAFNSSWVTQLFGRCLSIRLTAPSVRSSETGRRRLLPRPLPPRPLSRCRFSAIRASP